MTNVSISEEDKARNKLKKKYIEIIFNIKEANQMLSFDEITSILIDSINADLFGNFDVYSYL
jgi:hypothetical protein